MAKTKSMNGLIPYQFDLTGRCIKSLDPAKIAIEIDDQRTQQDNFSELKNIKYTDNGLRGVTAGMTKVNTTALTTHPKIRNMFQFKKDQPSETHLLVQAFNTGETESKVFQNTTAIPSAGDFSATALHTDTSGAGVGRFSDAPDEHVAYSNGKETLVWGGDETRVSNFTVYDPSGSFKYSYTDKVQNTLTDADNVASLYQVPASIDSNTLVLFHFDDTAPFLSSDTDNTHSGIAVGGMNRSAAQSVFGGYSALFDGTDDVVTIADHAELDLSGGTWTVEGRVYATDLSTEVGVYAQGTTGADTDYMAITITTSAAVKLSIFAAGAEVVALETAGGLIQGSTWNKISVVSSPGSSNTDYRIFINGIQKGFVNDAQKPANYNSTAVIGARITGDTTDMYFTGYIDEFRLSDSSRWTSDYDVPTVAYGTDAIVYMRVGNIMPLEAIKFYVSTANTTTGTASIFYWSGTGWAAVSTLVDGTSSGGVPLAQTGTMTFDSTATTAKQNIIDGDLAFWYLVQINLADTTTRISNITVTEPFQAIQDFWDGETRIPIACHLFENNINKDFTTNVFKDDFSYDNSTGFDESTYMQMDSLLTGTEYLQVGFLERQQALEVKMIPNHGNSASGTVIEVEYWNGTAWVSVGTIDDGTIENDISFSKSGYITWSPLGENIEFSKEISGGIPLFYYKLSWSKNFDGDVLCYHIGGIPSQRQLSNYQFSLSAQNRLWLFNNQSEKKNSSIVSGLNTLNVFNGKGSGDPLIYGDSTEVVAAAELFTRLTSSLKSIILVLKADSSFIVTGDNPEDFKAVQLTDSIGCNAALTLTTTTLGLEFSPLSRKQVAIWQGSSGIFMFDNVAIHDISGDISNFFDQTQSEAIKLSLAQNSRGWIEVDNGEHYYHWHFASGSSATALNAEWCFDIKRQKWFEYDRGSTKVLQGGSRVIDTSGNIYNYGYEDNGYVQRLNDGTNFDGNDITYHMEFGDIMPAGNMTVLTVLDLLKLITVSKTTTSNTIKVEHFGDTSTTATLDNFTNSNFYTFKTARSAHRLAMPSLRINTPQHVFHRLKFTITTNDESGTGFEPLYVGGFYKVTDNNDNNLTD
jgi:hypothetical protein